LDERLTAQIVEQVRARLDRLDDAVVSDRVSLPDSFGDHWAFNIVAYKSYPALGSGPIVFVCMLPGVTDWAAVRASDLHADPEMTRLLPSIKFMQQEFQRGPNLTDIAKVAHLSPFHFHRQFSELLVLRPSTF